MIAFIASSLLPAREFHEPDHFSIFLAIPFTRGVTDTLGIAFAAAFTTVPASGANFAAPLPIALRAIAGAVASAPTAPAPLAIVPSACRLDTSSG